MGVQSPPRPALHRQEEMPMIGGPLSPDLIAGPGVGRNHNKTACGVIALSMYLFQVFQCWRCHAAIACFQASVSWRS